MPNTASSTAMAVSKITAMLATTTAIATSPDRHSGSNFTTSHTAGR
jgi:hypothetical protein